MATVKEIQHDWITLEDGTRLAYRAWLPTDAQIQPVPAILEFLPYRKSDGTVIRDEITMVETAEQGYACIRVDLRGTGESEGFFDDEYSPQELKDGCEVIEYLAKQPWCNGNVGMMGISWGGFNSLQIAALNPPSLKAIITICSTDDRYRDDIHYLGGCMLNDNMDWAAFFWAYAQARCPDPKFVGEDWQQTWLSRLETMPNLSDIWLSEQTRSEYWQHGSVCEDFSQIQIPVYTIGGWADTYRNTVFSLLSNLSGPKKGLIGPWAHKYPNIAYPNPQMDFVKESVRWWDKWLKDIDNGIDQEPELHYYLQDSVKPQGDYEYRPGRWVSEPCWPSPNTVNETFYFHQHGLASSPSHSEPLSIQSPHTVGLDGGRLCAGIRMDMEHPVDQRIDDAGSLVFDSETLTQDLNIAGQIQAKLRLASDRENGQICVRISDVHPTGEVTRVTHGVLNLSHRNSHEKPELMNVGQEYDIDVDLYHMAYVIPKGHKLRIAISTAYWPLVWPSAESTRLTVFPQACELIVPTNPTPQESELVPDYAKPLEANGEQRRQGDCQRVVHRDYKTGMTHLETNDDFGCWYFNSADTEVDFKVNQTLSIHPDNPLSAKNQLALSVAMGREGWRTGLEGVYTMTCDETYFYVKVQWKATCDGQVVFEKQFDNAILRQYM